ncbi:MAG TPA: LOG family protein [Anaerolineales bacterium]|nr:LOG family protein [Anaerolineales bacterium]
MAAHITVFGGSQPKPGDPVYQDALHLGQLLARAGYTLLNGGYIGTMEALSRGAAELGGHVIGVTCDEIEAWRPVKANRWVTEEWHYTSLQERMFALIRNADAFLALPGGVGTLAEISLTWNLLITEVVSPCPLILIGAGWRETMRHFLGMQGEFIPEIQRKWVTLVPDIHAAFQILQDMLADGKFDG